jgi:hypothetical protein
LVSDKEYLDYLEPRLVELLGLIQRYKDVDQKGEALKQTSEALKRYSKSIEELNNTEKKKKKLYSILVEVLVEYCKYHCR